LFGIPLNQIETLVEILKVSGLKAELIERIVKYEENIAGQKSIAPLKPQSIETWLMQLLL
jgi:hypothetical protein